MNPDLWLLRHGETEAGKAYIGRSDPPLTAQGWQQMQQALATAPGWQRIISSPRQRCLAFARHLAEQQGLAVEVMPAFAEYDFGVMEGLTALEVMAEHPGVLEAFWQDPIANPPPGAEPLADFEQRLRQGLRALAGQPQPQLLVCHGGVIRALRCFEQGQPFSQLLQHSAPHGVLVPLSLEALL